MAWNVLSAFTAYQRLTASAMEQIRANLNHLKSPQMAISDVTHGTDFTTTSTSFTDVSTTWYQVTITPSITTGTCSLRVWANLSVKPSTSATVYVVRFDILVDGVSITGGSGLNVVEGNQNQVYAVNIDRIVTGVTPGAKVVKLQWRVASGGTATIWAASGGARQARAQFGAMEI